MLFRLNMIILVALKASIKRIYSYWYLIVDVSLQYLTYLRQLQTDNYVRLLILRTLWNVLLPYQCFDKFHIDYWTWPFTSISTKSGSPVISQFNRHPVKGLWVRQPYLLGADDIMEVQFNASHLCVISPTLNKQKPLNETGNLTG